MVAVEVAVVGAALVDDDADEEVVADASAEADAEVDDAAARASRAVSSSPSTKVAQPPSSAIATSATTGPRFLMIER